ncbi:hypothetical protein HID58_044343 [Brassica napus]|uniref:Activator of Hsp90 ATPase AHSA1-like N-terminal domain-containing protein n=1 Tax=Brassica napus TaxID=3708 RepID=A0ABQ8BKS4_BRANA|nr:hypothetical protein HID58_044343 [Brassica napus]
MAKFVEGDKRWIVEDRPDGTNVHNWHWAETNCLEWSRNFFNNQFSDAVILSGESNLFLKINKVEKLEGEAYVNVRKGKIIPGYELNVSLSWQGEAKDSEGRRSRRRKGWWRCRTSPMRMPMRIQRLGIRRVSVKDDGEIGKTLKEAMVTKGKVVVQEKVRVYVEAMARGGPCRDELEFKKVAPKAKEKSSGLPVVSDAKESKVVKEKKGKTKEGGLLKSNAKISRDVSGAISLFDGSVTGMNLELEEGKLIVQKWRFGSRPDGLDLTVRITFEEPEPGVTIVNLTQ